MKTPPTTFRLEARPVAGGEVELISRGETQESGLNAFAYFARRDAYTGRRFGPYGTHRLVLTEEPQAAADAIHPLVAELVAERAAEMLAESTRLDPFVVERVAKSAHLVAGLRELADWIETHPDLPLPAYPNFTWATSAAVAGGGDFDDAAGLAYITAVARELDTTVRDSGDGYCSADRKFGPVSFGASHAGNAGMAQFRAALSYDGAVQPEAAS